MRHLHAPESNHFNASSLRRNMFWMSRQSNMISWISFPLSPNTSRSCGACIVLSPSLHPLLYQLCILYISLGTPSIAQSGRKSLPYLNSTGQSSKPWIWSTPTSSLCSVSVRGKEKPERLLALEFGSSFDWTSCMISSSGLSVAGEHSLFF